MISQELLTELKEILEEDFGLKLTMGEVPEIATGLVSYFDLLIKINASETNKDQQKPTKNDKLINPDKNDK